jgi:nicotinamidase-related amidase
MGRTTSQVTVTGTATQICALNANRTAISLNNAGPVTVYLGPTSAVTTSTGDELFSGQSEHYSKEEGDDTVSPIYGITAGTNATVAVEEDVT